MFMKSFRILFSSLVKSLDWGNTINGKTCPKSQGKYWREMKYLQTILLILLLLGCEEKQLSLKDTVIEYYETMLQGQMEASQELLDWDTKEGSVIDYYANMGKLHKEYHLVSLEDVEITNISEKDGEGKADVKLIYMDKDGKERSEINKVRLRLNSNRLWKITSIKRE